MIALHPNKLKNAIAKARQLRPRVQYLWWRTYLVTSPRSGNQYLVRFSITNGQIFADCSCKAGQSHVACFHIAAAASVQMIVAGMRRAFQKPTPSASSTPPRLPAHEDQRED